MAGLEEQVTTTMSSLWRGLIIWSVLFYGFCILVIVLPLAIASGLLPDPWVKIFALASAVCGGLLTWPNLGSVVRNFSTAYNNLSNAYTQYHVDSNKDLLLAQYVKAKTTVLEFTPGAP